LWKEDDTISLVDFAHTETLRAGSQKLKNANTGSANLGVLSIPVITLKYK